jgi:hypothetical protein
MPKAWLRAYMFFQTGSEREREKANFVNARIYTLYGKGRGGVSEIGITRVGVEFHMKYTRRLLLRVPRREKEEMERLSVCVREQSGRKILKNGRIYWNF